MQLQAFQTAKLLQADIDLLNCALERFPIDQEMPEEITVENLTQFLQSLVTYGFTAFSSPTVSDSMKADLAGVYNTIKMAFEGAKGKAETEFNAL